MQSLLHINHSILFVKKKEISNVLYQLSNMIKYLLTIDSLLLLNYKLKYFKIYRYIK